jgi:hypothetical protein
MSSNGEPYEQPELAIYAPVDDMSEEEVKQMHEEQHQAAIAEAEAEAKANEEQALAINKASEEAMIRAEAEHQAANQAEHEERLAAAAAFDWDAWEEETGLTRPEIGG